MENNPLANDFQRSREGRNGSCEGRPPDPLGRRGPVKRRNQVATVN